MSQEIFQVDITADDIVSTDSEFSMSRIWRGDQCIPVEIYFENKDGVRTTRNYRPRERKISGQVLPRLCFQKYEKDILSMSQEEMADFPVCDYGGDSFFKGIFFSVEEFRAQRNTIEYLVYQTSDNRELVIYCWNIFSTLLFVQECLKRFGDPGDKFVLRYREKTLEENSGGSGNSVDIDTQTIPHEELSYANLYSPEVIRSKNVVFRGAPGTGKSYLAKQIAADIVTQGAKKNYIDLDPQELSQIEFVQFHPSYDYTDFVEGLRPSLNDDGGIGFVLKNGIFKRFVNLARKNYEDSSKSGYEIEKEFTAEALIEDFLNNIIFEETEFFTKNNSLFHISDASEDKILINVPGNSRSKSTSVKRSELRRLLEVEDKFNSVSSVANFLGRSTQTQGDSYLFSLYNKICGNTQAGQGLSNKVVHRKNFVFIIDEINRGEISKIFGELFFSIDPDYRGVTGEVSTQYSNLQEEQCEKFYVPDNLYIIGTMNDIDRSVDTFDFAMRRRFRFIEITAESQLAILNQISDFDVREEAKRRLLALNKKIEGTEELNRNYQIGPAYMLKAEKLGFDVLWTDYLEPLLADYVRGLYNEGELLEGFRDSYESGAQSEDYV